VEVIQRGKLSIILGLDGGLETLMLGKIEGRRMSRKSGEMTFFPPCA